MFWQCSLLIGNASSLECNQSGCGVVHSGYSGCFVMTKNVLQHKIVKGGKLQKSEFSLSCVVIAEGSTNALPVSTSIPAHFFIPVSLHNKNVLLRCLINDILVLPLSSGQKAEVGHYDWSYKVKRNWNIDFTSGRYEVARRLKYYNLSILVVTKLEFPLDQRS